MASSRSKDGDDDAAAAAVEAESDRSNGVSSVFDRGLSVIVSFFSAFIFNLLLATAPDRFSLTLVVVAAFALWMLIERQMRRWIKGLWTLRENPTFRGVLVDGIDFLTMLGIFIVFQFFVSILSNFWTAAGLDALESIAGIYAIVMITFTVVRTFRSAES